jgi:hypothetical protein
MHKNNKADFPIGKFAHIYKRKMQQRGNLPILPLLILF